MGAVAAAYGDTLIHWDLRADDVRLHRTGIKQLHHPVVGDLDLNFETLQLTADPA